jgi:DNA polymerase-3 subunit delta'
MLEQLMRSARAGRIVHALLFTGPRGFGKRTAARLFTQALFCTGAEKPCGVCPACRQVENGTHPDVHILRPDGRDIKVDQARQLIDDISVMPYEGAMHAVVIERADRMNESTQNALLKTLENPVVPAIFSCWPNPPRICCPQSAPVASRCASAPCRRKNAPACS